LDNFKYLFVYGSLKKGFKNESILKDCTFLSTCSTIEKYEMYPTLDYAFPFLFVSDREIAKNVKGELYKVDDELLKKLDIFEGIDYDFYTRKKIYVNVNNSKVRAFCYITNAIDTVISNIELTPSPLSEWTKEYENCGIELERYSSIINNSTLDKNTK